MKIEYKKNGARIIKCENCDSTIIEEVGTPSDYIETTFYLFDKDSLLICRECKSLQHDNKQ